MKEQTDEVWISSKKMSDLSSLKVKKIPSEFLIFNIRQRKKKSAYQKGTHFQNFNVHKNGQKITVCC